MRSCISLALTPVRKFWVADRYSREGCLAAVCTMTFAFRQDVPIAPVPSDGKSSNSDTTSTLQSGLVVIEVQEQQGRNSTISTYSSICSTSSLYIAMINNTMASSFSSSSAFICIQPGTTKTTRQFTKYGADRVKVCVHWGYRKPTRVGSGSPPPPPTFFRTGRPLTLFFASRRARIGQALPYFNPWSLKIDVF